MQTFLIVIHLMIVLALVGVVLLQRSEGGGLGIGGGSGFMTARGASNALTRATALLAAGFFATSLALSIHARYQDRPTDILDRVPIRNNDGSVPTGGGVLDQLGGSSNAPTAPGGVPQGDAPTAPTAPAPVVTPEAPTADESPAPAPAGEAPAAPQAPTNQ